MSLNKKIFLFDVDGTLTDPRQKISNEMKQFLKYIRTKYPIAIVGGSDLSKQREQLGDSLLRDLIMFLVRTVLFPIRMVNYFINKTSKSILDNKKLTDSLILV